MPIRPRQTPDVLQEMADVYVHYEMTRMAQWAKLATRNDLVNEAILESYLIHVRNMHEFLTTRAATAHTGAVVAEDYFLGEWKLDGKVLTRAQENGIHRRIAHLSIQRLRRNTPEGKPFDWAGHGDLDV